MRMRGDGGKKRVSSELVISSAERGWQGISAHLWSHSDGIIVHKRPPAPGDTLMMVDVRGNTNSVVALQAGAIFDRTVAELGTAWICPAELHETLLEFSDPLPGMLHIRLPSSPFSALGLGEGLHRSIVPYLRYEGGFHDPLIAQMAYAILSELQMQTSSGKLLVETLACSLAARLVQKHVRAPLDEVRAIIVPRGLAPRRLARVLDFIGANLEREITIDSLASIACLSRFHFARAFKAATGQSPHKYVSTKRLERAKLLLSQGDRSLADIASALGFSSQANFTRAFRKSTGLPPGQFREEKNSR